MGVIVTINCNQFTQRALVVRQDRRSLPHGTCNHLQDKRQTLASCTPKASLWIIPPPPSLKDNKYGKYTKNYYSLSET